MSFVPATAPFWSRSDLAWRPGQGRLAQSIELEEAAPRPLVVATVAVLVAAIALFVVWAAVTPIGEVATASGDVVPTGSVRRIQHLEGGIVSAVRVREGETVEPGQVLFELDGAGILPELQQLRTRLAALTLQQAQLAAYRSGAAAPDGQDGAFGRLATAQNDLLRDKRAAFEAQGVLLGEQLQQRRAELASIRSQTATANDQFRIVSEQVSTRQGLVEKGLSPRMNLLDLQRDQARVRSQMAEIEGQIARAERSVAEAEARMPDLVARTNREIAEDSAKVEGELAETREAVARAEDRVRRLTVRSPVRGVVKGLQTEALGGVVAPGSTLTEIIPSGVAPLVEARVQPRDIGFVRVGQAVDVKVMAYDYTRFGAATGRIETISATTFQDEKGTPYYRARISLASDRLSADPARTLITPGMTVIADIQTGSKTVLSYLLKPIVRATSEALRER